ncbi:MAG: RDD family protein [Ruminococcaceae bacterium]|nr:RDD family protein [Oscillospiraceae bacterium]
MMHDVQRANMWKRISAGFLDMILLIMLISLLAVILFEVFNYNAYISTLNDKRDEYAQKYNITFDITEEELASLQGEDEQRYLDALQALDSDAEFLYAYNMTTNMLLAVVAGSMFLSFLLLEFIVPLLFGNGQTLGKKIFGLALMRTDSVKLTNFALFVRSILGKLTIETLIPVMLWISGTITPIGVIAPVVTLGILGIQAGLLVASRNRACIHDMMAVTVVIDYSSQMIFDSVEDLTKHKMQLAAEEAQRQEY